MRTRERVWRIGWYVVLAIVVILTLAPLVWMISTSLKPETQITTTEIRWIPETITLENFQAVLERHAMLRWTFNSLVVATTATLLVLILDSLAGYALARMYFLGRDLLFLVILSMLFVPIQITVVPLFLLFSKMGLTDNHIALIVPVGATVTGVFLMRQFFLSIPSELEDAARVDGANDLRIWWSIVLPLARPALIAVAIITFLSTWNSFFWPLIVTHSDSIRPLQVGLAYFSREQSTNYTLLMAATTMAIIPLIILFFVAQKHIIASQARSGLKE